MKRWRWMLVVMLAAFAAGGCRAVGRVDREKSGTYWYDDKGQKVIRNYQGLPPPPEPEAPVAWPDRDGR